MASIYNAANGLRSDSGNSSRGFSRFSPQNVNNNFGSPNGPQNVDFGPDVFLTNEVHEINEFGKPLGGEGYNSNSDPFGSGKYGLSGMGMQSQWKNNMMSSGGYRTQNGLQLGGSDYQQQSNGLCPCGKSHHNQNSRSNFKSNYDAYDGNNSFGRNSFNYNTMNREEQNVDYSYGGFGF